MESLTEEELYYSAVIPLNSHCSDGKTTQHIYFIIELNFIFIELVMNYNFFKCMNCNVISLGCAEVQLGVLVRVFGLIKKDLGWALFF